MKELMTKKDEYIRHTNDLTREMDNYLSDNLKKIKEQYGSRTYIEKACVNNLYLIRHPGATRGTIVTDKNDIITDIYLNKDETNTHKIYDPRVEECFEKYIGMKILWED